MSVEGGQEDVGCWNEKRFHWNYGSFSTWLWGLLCVQQLTTSCLPAISIMKEQYLQLDVILGQYAHQKFISSMSIDIITKNPWKKRCTWTRFCDHYCCCGQHIFSTGYRWPGIYDWIIYLISKNHSSLLPTLINGGNSGFANLASSITFARFFFFKQQVFFHNQWRSYWAPCCTE